MILRDPIDNEIATCCLIRSLKDEQKEIKGAVDVMFILLTSIFEKQCDLVNLNCAAL